jgi:hypothetical protein
MRGALQQKRRKVASYAVVGIVAPHHRDQMGLLVRDGLMPIDPTPSRHRRQRSGVTVLCRYLSGALRFLLEQDEKSPPRSALAELR